MTVLFVKFLKKNENTLQVLCKGSMGRMHADPTRIRQMLANLLSNACKFTHQGQITLDVFPEEGKHHKWLNIIVKDTGIGMTAEQMPRLFQPFSRVAGNRERKYEGTGLGLVITRQFCNMMGGNIEVTSEYGRGSTFKMKLPKEKNHPEVVVLPAINLRQTAS